jgi:translation initiation factor IF-2
MVSQRSQEEALRQEEQRHVLKVTEFVSVNELATMMSTPVNEIIATCMSLGLFVSINQRLDAETMAILAEEFGYTVEFISADVQESIQEYEDKPEDLLPRPPIVTVMGHVDHGKTKLLDYIRHANVIAGEAGGITQHIGAYGVVLDDGRKITFLDTPGHEAFTAMRARGAQVTDVAIIVVAADDGVMPQTVEAINHAQAAQVPMVFAINKIDKQTANPEKIKEGLANMNILVEDWGGKFQSQGVSAKDGTGISDLLDKVLLEAEMLDLKANPNKNAVGTVVESSLDKGRGYVATILVQAGTLHIGDIMLAGTHYGRIKAMYNERGKAVHEAGPSSPVLILGLDGAPQAGDKFNVMDNDREAREIANKREQLQREQGIRTQKHITLDEIGRRIAIGNFQELNVIVKGDVDGSVEALSDSLIKLSTEEIQVNIIHKAVGQISEGDVLLAAASNAIVVGFQVRPSMSARKLAEKEEIDIRLYSIIYDAINEIRSAMEGMLSPEIKEDIVATLEIQETFKITKVGTIAGCIVREGKIKRNSKIRIIRDGIVIYTGELGSLKRFKDDVKEVVSGQDCGLNIANFNDIKIGDIVEAYEQFEVKKKL